jgi:DNA-binding LytR/AlgR family response regulator
MKLKCIAVDDESLARKLLEENIQQLPFLELVATCKNPFEAMEVLQREQVDLMFLDIQMPGMLGTKFLTTLREKPLVIFVTAYSNYAVESYDLEVVDYLMKPVSMERFTKAALKAQENWLLRKRSAPSIAEQPNNPAPAHFFVNVEYSLVKIVVDEITHIEGMKDYVKIFLNGTKRPVLTKSTMKGIEEKLPGRRFFRVHKSFIINVEKVESIRSHQITIGQHEIPVSESNMDLLMNLLNHSK